MAKSSGKSTKKSGNTKTASRVAGKKADKTIEAKANKDSSSNKKSKTETRAPSEKKTNKKPKKEVKQFPKNEDKPKKSRPKKQPVLKCEFCQKIMKDQKTLKIHERNCQAKREQENEKKLHEDMLRMQDDFEDERQSIIDKFSKREDALQNELDEIRTVLRMEMDKHRKELDMIQDVRKQTRMIAENSTNPVSEPVHMPDSRPKAIDKIPIPLPKIPKKIIEPMPIDSEGPYDKAPREVKLPHKTEPVSAMDIETKDKMMHITEPEPVQQTHEKIKSEPAESIKKNASLSKNEIEGLVKSLVKQSMLDGASSVETIPNLEKLNEKNRQISGRLDAVDSKLNRFNNEMRKNLEKIENKSEIKRMEKEIGKISEKIVEMMEDIGFGENLSVSKIPPTILEIVYQATLDDIHSEIVRTMGVQDAEKIARNALEDVRMKTSGSELFMFDGRRIVTDNLARSIEANLISAKQIQTTYDVLQERLLETVPHHKAKNFRGMIKVKSQEFAVERATALTKEFTRMSNNLENINQMIAAISAQINGKNQEIQEALNDIKDNLLADKADMNEMDILKIKLQELEEKDAKLNNELALIRVEIEMKEEISEKEAQGEFQSIIIPGETIDAEEIIEESKRDISPEILKSIQKGASSKTAIIRDTGMEEEDILAAIATLVRDNKVMEKKIGKRIKYMTPEQDINEKLKADELKNISKKKEDIKRKKSVKKDKTEIKTAEKKDSGKKQEKSSETQKKPAKTGPAGKKKPVKEKAPKPVKKDDANTEKISEKKESGKKQEKGPKTQKTSAKKTEPAGKEKNMKKNAPSSDKKPKKKEKTGTKKSVEKDAEKDKKNIGKSTDSADKSPKDEKKTDSPTKKVDEKKSSPPGKETHIDDELPVITKKLEDLSEDERQVLDSMTHDGMSISGIQSKVGKAMKRFALLRALRVLIDSGYVEIITKGRMDLYRKINVKKMDKPKQEKNKMEVK